MGHKISRHKSYAVCRVNGIQGWYSKHESPDLSAKTDDGKHVSFMDVNANSEMIKHSPIKDYAAEVNIKPILLKEHEKHKPKIKLKISEKEPVASTNGTSHESKQSIDNERQTENKGAEENAIITPQKQNENNLEKSSEKKYHNEKTERENNSEKEYQNKKADKENNSVKVHQNEKAGKVTNSGKESRVEKVDKDNNYKKEYQNKKADKENNSENEYKVEKTDKDNNSVKEYQNKKADKDNSVAKAHENKKADKETIRNSDLVVQKSRQAEPEFFFQPVFTELENPKDTNRECTEDRSSLKEKDVSVLDDSVKSGDTNALHHQELEQIQDTIDIDNTEFIHLPNITDIELTPSMEVNDSKDGDISPLDFHMPVFTYIEPQPNNTDNSQSDRRDKYAIPDESMEQLNLEENVNALLDIHTKEIEKESPNMEPKVTSNISNTDPNLKYVNSGVTRGDKLVMVDGSEAVVYSPRKGKKLPGQSILKKHINKEDKEVHNRDNPKHNSNAVIVNLKPNHASKPNLKPVSSPKPNGKQVTIKAPQSRKEIEHANKERDGSPRKENGTPRIISPYSPPIHKNGSHGSPRKENGVPRIISPYSPPIHKNGSPKGLDPRQRQLQPEPVPIAAQYAGGIYVYADGTVIQYNDKGQGQMLDPSALHRQSYHMNGNASDPLLLSKQQYTHNGVRSQDVFMNGASTKPLKPSKHKKHPQKLGSRPKKDYTIVL